MVTMGKLPLTPRAKNVIELAMQEARELKHNYVGTEHLLLGLMKETEGIAAQVLTNMGLDLNLVRSEILNLIKDPTYDIKNPGPEKAWHVSGTITSNSPVEQVMMAFKIEKAKTKAEFFTEVCSQLSDSTRNGMLAHLHKTDPALHEKVVKELQSHFCKEAGRLTLEVSDAHLINFFPYTESSGPANCDISES